MICPNCNRTNKEGSKFCIHCRAPLSQGVPVQAERGNQRLPQRAVQPGNAGNQNPKTPVHYLQGSAFRVACPSCANPVDPALRVCPRCRTPLNAMPIPRHGDGRVASKRRAPLGKTIARFLVTSGASSGLGYGMNAIAASISRTASPETAAGLAQAMPWVGAIVSFIISTVVGSLFKPKKKPGGAPRVEYRRAR